MASPLVTAARREQPPKYRLLATTMKGRKGNGAASENQDRVLKRVFRSRDPSILLGVADGVTCCPAGGAIAEYVVETRLGRDRLFPERKRPRLEQLVSYLEGMNTRFYQEFSHVAEMLESACTLSLAFIEGRTASLLWVGDSPIVIARRRGEKFHALQISRPDVCGRMLIDCFGAHAPFELKTATAEIAPGDVLAVGSDGAIRGPEMLADLLNDWGPTPEMLRVLKAQASDAPYYDDASIVLAEAVE